MAETQGKPSLSRVVVELTEMPENRPKTAKTGLSAAQERALVSLLSCPSQEAAAQQAQVGTRTLRRYLKDPAFAQEYLARRKELMAAAVSLAQQHAASMVIVQIVIAKDPAMPPSTRVTAAMNVLSLGQAGLQAEDLEQRILKLEGVLYGNESGITGSKNGTNHRRVFR
jgi:hypothetical protein